MSDKLYMQCVLMQPYENGRLFTVGWIDEHVVRQHLSGEISNLRVTLKGEDGWWTIREVAEPPRSIKDIEEVNAKTRRSLNSISDKVST